MVGPRGAHEVATADGPLPRWLPLLCCCLGGCPRCVVAVVAALVVLLPQLLPCCAAAEVCPTELLTPVVSLLPPQGWASYDAKVDLFSLGVVVFEMWHPFSTGMERVLLLQALRDQGKLPEVFERDHLQVAKLIRCRGPGEGVRGHACVLQRVGKVVHTPCPCALLPWTLPLCPEPCPCALLPLTLPLCPEPRPCALLPWTLPLCPELCPCALLPLTLPLCPEPCPCALLPWTLPLCPEPCPWPCPGG